MHNKFCLFGEKVVWTGSFNFTYDATRFHRENVVIIEDVELVSKYREQFFAIKNQGTRPLADYVSHHPKPKKNVLDAILHR